MPARFVLTKEFGGAAVLASPRTFGSAEEAVETALEVAHTDRYEVEGRTITAFQRLGEATTFTLIPTSDWLS